VSRRPLRFGSVCSGIEAASVAWEPLGWLPVWFAEIEPFPSAVLAHHYPDVPNLGDMTRLAARILAGEVEAPDIFVGGTPCQSFSVAGLRKGLDDPRGQLTRSFVEIADAIDTVRAAQGLPPAVILWENVPGVLSDNGNAFGNFLGALAGEDIALDPSGGKWTNAGLVLGPAREVCWRVLDAQYFGVAQRRRRVFVVAGSRAGGVRASQVLLVESGVRRDSPPSREAGQRPAGASVAGAASGGGERGAGRDGGVVVAPPLTATNDPSRSPQSAEVTAQVHAVLQAQTIAHRQAAFVKGTNPHSAEEAPRWKQTEVSACLNGWDERHDPPKHVVATAANVGVPDVAWCLQHRDAKGVDSDTKPGHILPVAVWTGDGVVADPIVPAGRMAVRRLTPTECERLQGFPDDYTRIPWKKKPVGECPDGPRYKALGNSMAVPCMNWLGRKINAEYWKRHDVD